MAGVDRAMTAAEGPGSPAPRESLERTAFGALVALLLAPVVAHGAWRPWVHVLGPAGTAMEVTLAALLVSLVIVVAQRLLTARAAWSPLISGLIVALALSETWSLGAAGCLSLLGVAGATARILPWLSPRLPTSLDGLFRRQRGLTVLYVLVALGAVVSTARLSVFIGDPTQVEMQMLPGDKFVETHSCLTAYVRAASLAREGAHNLYDDTFWYGSNGLPPLPEGTEPPYPPFSLDNFSYPPPFLLVASLLAPLEGDFFAQRALWFGLNGLLLAVGLWVAARFGDGSDSHRALLLAPLFFGSLPILLTLQIGNFHIAAAVLAIIALVAIERGQTALGGGLLALTILSKISPGVLGIVLLAQRRYRGAAFAAGFGALLLGLSLLCFGVDPLVSFVSYALPRLSSGAAFPFMETESGIVTNMAPFGIPFKLQLLGVQIADPWALAQTIARVYSVLLVLLALVAARSRASRRDKLVLWLLLLFLAALQSPFSPAYATIGLLWATTFLAIEVRSFVQGLGLVLLWLAILVVATGMSAEVKAVQSLGQTALSLGFASWVIVRVARRREPGTLAATSPNAGRKT